MLTRDTPFEFSKVRGPTDTAPQRVAETWGEFLARLAKPEVRGKLPLGEYLADDKPARNRQKAGPGWIPATFRDKGRRTDGDVLGATALVGDLDDGRLDRAELTRRLNGYAHAGHTSYSHAPGSPRYRVVLPMARPLPPARYGAAWERLNALLDGALDPSGRNPSHFYYLPAVPPGGEDHFDFWSADGEPFDPDAPEAEESPEAAGPAPEVDLDRLAISERIRRLIREGVAADAGNRYEGDRSRALFGVLLALVAARLSDDQIVDVLTHEEHALAAVVLEHARRPERVAHWLAPQIKKARERVAADGFVGFVSTPGGVFEHTRAGGGSWRDPADLPSELPHVAPFDPLLLPEALRPWVEDVAERIQCPPDFPAVGTVVALAAVVGRRIGIRPKRHDDWIVVPNLWGGVVGRPSVMKSPALAEPLRFVDRLEAQARERHEFEAFDYEAKKLAWEGRLAGLKRGKAPGEAEIRAHLEGRPEPPARRRYVMHDTTVEKLGELLAANPRGVLVFRDELVGLLKGLDRDGQEGARAFFLEAWNGTGRFTFDRIVRGTVEIEAACLSILRSIQPAPWPSTWPGR